MSRHIGRSLTAFVLAVAAIAGSTQFVADPGGCRKPRRGCVCPAIFDPVVCDRGCTYSNACFAACANATGCVPAS